jgi:hypothetical protein
LAVSFWLLAVGCYPLFETGRLEIEWLEMGRLEAKQAGMNLVHDGYPRHA